MSITYSFSASSNYLHQLKIAPIKENTAVSADWGADFLYFSVSTTVISLIQAVTLA
jgi:hypothetical protein